LVTFLIARLQQARECGVAFVSGEYQQLLARYILSRRLRGANSTQQQPE
jgi:hypothetical protein